VDWQALEAFGTTLAAVVAIGYGLYEFRSRYLASLNQRAAELLAVTLTYELKRPQPSEARKRTATYTYRWTVHNPGRLPITNVTVEMSYPGLVQRAHSDGTLEKPSATHEMKVAAVAGHHQYTWRRALQVPVEVDMERTTAKIRFRAADVGDLETTWPEAPTSPNKRLRKRLPASVKVGRGGGT
jgi:hypothetical protein